MASKISHFLKNVSLQWLGHSHFECNNNQNSLKVLAKYACFMMLTRNVKIMLSRQIGFRKKQFDKLLITENLQPIFINKHLSLNIDQAHNYLKSELYFLIVENFVCHVSINAHTNIQMSTEGPLLYLQIGYTTMLIHYLQ